MLSNDCGTLGLISTPHLSILLASCHFLQQHDNCTLLWGFIEQQEEIKSQIGWDWIWPTYNFDQDLFDDIILYQIVQR